MHDVLPLFNNPRCSILFLTAVLGVSPLCAQTGTAPDVGIRDLRPAQVMLTGAHVVISSDRELESARLLIENGKVTAVGATLETPAGAEVIDLTGKYIYPAFIDSLAEFESEPVELRAGYWNQNVVPQRCMDQSGKWDDARIEAFRKSGVAIVLAAPKDGIIKGQSCVVLTNSLPLEQSVVVPQAFQHLQLYPARRAAGYPNSPMGAVALIRQALADADWYQRAWQAVNADPAIAAPEYNAALTDLQAAIRGKQTVVMDGTNELYALRADRLAREFSLKLIVRGSGREYRRLEAIQATHRTFIVPLNFPDAPKVESRGEALGTNLQELMHWRLAPENPARLEGAGVDFVLTADGLSKTSDLLPKVRQAIERGLSQRAALRALTQRPAEILAIDHLAGTLEPGKLANLIVASGPLFDKSSKIDETWVSGKRFQWNSTQEQDLRGTWQLAISGDVTASLTLKLSGAPEKLKGDIGLPAAFVKPTAEDDPAASEDQPLQPPGSGENPAQEAQRDASLTAEEPTAQETKTDNIEEQSERKDGQDEGSEPQEGKETAKPKSVELKGLAFNGYQLSGTFEVGPLLENLSGAAIFGAALLPSGDELELLGTINWPDGGQSRFSAHRDPADAAEPSNKEPAKKEEQSPAALVACEVNYPLGAYGITGVPQPTEWLLVKGATIWTCGEQGIIESADMLVHNGIIESVGTDLAAPTTATPPAVTIIDARGMHLSPGIIDCHSHMATDGGVNESGQAVTAEVRIGDFIDPNDITIYRQLAGGVTTANILHGSANPIGGQNQVIKLRWGSLDEAMKMREAPAGIKFALGENVKQSAYRDSTRYPQTRMGVEQIMRDRFEAAILYRQQWSQWSTNPRGLPPRRDFELEAIAEVVEKTRWIHCHSYRQDEILTMLRTLDDYHITIGSLQHILEGYKVADAMAAHGAMGSSFSDWWAYKFEVYDAIPYNGALMHQAGVVVSFNSDDAELARHLNHEAAKAVKYGGVSPHEALKFVTLNPAKQLRIDRWVGSLEPGKQADFAIWNRSPLSTLSVCTQTWIDGRKYFDREQDEQRRQTDAKLHRDLVQSIISSDAKTRTSPPDDDPSYWWERHDAFCHHGHDEHDQHNETHDQQDSEEQVR